MERFCKGTLYLRIMVMGRNRSAWSYPRSLIGDMQARAISDSDMETLLAISMG